MPARLGLHKLLCSMGYGVKPWCVGEVRVVRRVRVGCGWSAEERGEEWGERRVERRVQWEWDERGTLCLALRLS